MTISDNAGLQSPTAQGEDAEDITTRVERLGRERPERFTTSWQEMGFCISLLTSITMAVSKPQHRISVPPSDPPPPH